MLIIVSLKPFDLGITIPLFSFHKKSLHGLIALLVSSSRSGFGNYEIWIVFCGVRVACFTQLFQSFNLVLVSPDDPMLIRVGFSVVNPSLPGPVMDSLELKYLIS